MEVIKFRSQLFIAFEHAGVNLHRAQNALARLKRIFANKARGLGYVLRAKAKVRLHRVWNALTRPKRIFANKARGLGYVLRAKAKVRLHRVQNALARPKRIFANKARGLGCVLRAKTKVRLHRVQYALANLKWIFADKARGSGDMLRAKMIDSGEQLTAPLRRIRSRFAGVRRSIVEKPQRLQETLHAGENILPKLLESSDDAMVVLNKELRFVGANSKALDVFGVSEKNITMFSMDAFLRGQTLPFDKNGAPFTSQKEWHGECKIQRLDGSLRVAEFVFVANYVPLLHVCMFRNDRKLQSEKRFAA